MTLTVASNSTPLIALSKIGRFHIIEELFQSITIPEAVFDEVAGDTQNRPGCEQVSGAEWIRVKKIGNLLSSDFLKINLDAGEAEAITLAKEIKADLLLIDDRAGRKVAGAVGIPVTGTVGILLRYYKGDKTAFKAALDELIAKGFRLSKAEYARILDMAR